MMEGMRMCNCLSIARFHDGTEDHGYPVSNHAPQCEDYKTERYIELFDDDGRRFIDTVENQYVFLSNNTGWKQRDVYITTDQFERMEEYQGL